MKIAVSFIIGIVFALGLGISGMTQPEKVLGFLDFGGKWDPSLMFVMGSAIPVYMAVWFARRKRVPVLGGNVPKAARHDLDVRLFVGAAIFGAGWGLAGICPGPAIVNLARPSADIGVFFACVIAGMLIYKLIDTARLRRASAKPA